MASSSRSASFPTGWKREKGGVVQAGDVLVYTGGTTSASTKISISSYTTLSDVAQGKPFGLCGKVTSGAKITSMTGSIVNSSGKAVYSRTVYPNSTIAYVQKTYGGKNLDSALRFNTLGKGSYRYVLAATNASGSATLINKAFTVK